MRHVRLPEAFTLIGVDEEGREYIQCTRTGDVLVQTGPDEWAHFASEREWRARTAALLYPEMVHLNRALKRVGAHEEIEDQIQAMKDALELTERLKENIRDRIAALESQR